MKTEMRERIVCCLLAVILFFLGIGVEMTTTNSSFLCPIIASGATNDSDSKDAFMYETSQIVEEMPTCTLNMLEKDYQIIRNNETSLMLRRVCRTVLLSLIAGIFLQYLLRHRIRENSYQWAECREDGQLFLCRAVAVKYIHKKDSGK